MCVCVCVCVCVCSHVWICWCAYLCTCMYVRACVRICSFFARACMLPVCTCEGVSKRASVCHQACVVCHQACVCMSSSVRLCVIKRASVFHQACVCESSSTLALPDTYSHVPTRVSSLVCHQAHRVSSSTSCVIKHIGTSCVIKHIVCHHSCVIKHISTSRHIQSRAHSISINELQACALLRTF